MMGILILVAMFFCATTASGEITQSQLETNFPDAIKIITFDNYADWDTLTWSAGGVQTDTAGDGTGFNGPTLSDASDTDWDRYATWNKTTEPTNWIGAIGDFGADYCAAGKCFTSSYNVDETYYAAYDHEDSVGVDNTWLYFGDNDNKNYGELYVFMRAYIPHNRWPTADTSLGWENRTVDFDDAGNPVVKHVEGHDYAYITSDKWIGFQAERSSAACHDPLNGDADTCTFPSYQLCGDIERWFHIKNLNSPSTQLQLKLAIYHSEPEENAYQNILGGVDISGFLDKNIGIEFYLKRETSIDAGDAVAKVWFYDEDGSATLVLDSTGQTLDLLHDDQTDGVDLAGLAVLWFVSNIRAEDATVSDGGYFRCGDGMRCNRWYDDIIIDEERIGPTYFDLAMGTPAAIHFQTSNLRLSGSNGPAVLQTQ